MLTLNALKFIIQRCTSMAAKMTGLTQGLVAAWKFLEIPVTLGSIVVLLVIWSVLTIIYEATHSSRVKFVT